MQSVKQSIVETNEEVLLQSFNLYTPHYDFMRADDYKARLLQNRAQQKEAIKNGAAVLGSTKWTVNGSLASGRKMVSDMQKLLLRAFNSECDDIVEHVKYNNIEASEKRIYNSREVVSKLGRIMDVSITN